MGSKTDPSSPAPGAPLGRDSLSAVVRGIHHAAASTQNMLAQQYIVMLDHFFRPPDLTNAAEKHLPREALVAKMVRVQIDPRHYTLVPLVSLMSPQGIYLKEMKVKLSVAIEESEAKAALADASGMDLDRTSFKVSLKPHATGAEGGRDPSVTEIELTFKSMPPAEGMMKVIQQFDGTIMPRSNSVEHAAVINPNQLRADEHEDGAATSAASPSTPEAPSATGGSSTAPASPASAVPPVTPTLPAGGKPTPPSPMPPPGA